MTSLINPTWPQEQQAKTANVRENFARAKAEIEALQATVAALEEAVANGAATNDWIQTVSSDKSIDFGAGNLPTPWSFTGLNLLTERYIAPEDAVTVSAMLMVREVSNVAPCTLEIGLSVNGAMPDAPVSTKILAGGADGVQTMLFSATGKAYPVGTTLSVVVRRGQGPDDRAHLVLPGSVLNHRLVLRVMPAEQ
jgi:hypothetical protein